MAVLFSFLNDSVPRLSNYPCRSIGWASIIYFFLICLFVVTIPTLKAAEIPPLPEVATTELPGDFSQVQFYLITVNVGNKVWDNFGHTALRVVDTNNNTDTVFNWGLFDTSGGLLRFSFNFFQGIMNYQLGTSSPQAEFDMYRGQARSVWQDKVNLNNRQKEILYRRLMWNLQPGNIVYSYRYFDDNCTTRLRDYLDEALGGKISAANLDLTENTYRDLVKFHYNSLPPVKLGLDILMNGNIDRRISAWEEMFLPLSLRARLAQLQSDVAVNGEQLPLLSQSMVIMEFPSPSNQPDPYPISLIVVALPALLLFLFVQKQSMSYFATHSRMTLGAPGFSYRILALVAGLMCLISGLFGVFMLGGWFFSGHEDLYSNINLLLFWPTDLLGVLVALRWLVAAKPWPTNNNSAPFINYYMFARLISLLAYGVVSGLGLAAQETRDVALFLAPGVLLLIILIWLVGFEPDRRSSMFL